MWKLNYCEGLQRQNSADLENLDLIYVWSLGKDYTGCQHFSHREIYVITRSKMP